MTMRLLLVDDEGSLRLTLAANLEMEGFEVVEAETAERALEIARDQTFDLVLSDIRMPGMNGVDLYRSIRRLHPDVPVILMTAFALESLVSDAIREGVFTVLPKPFDIEHVVAILSVASRRPAVLVVDGARSEAEGLVAAIKTAGLRSRLAADAASALSAIRESHVDICVIDLSVPDAGPVELIESIRAADPRVLFIAIAGKQVPELTRRVAGLNAFAWMRKPLAAGDLLEVVAKARGSSPSLKKVSV